MKQTKLTLGVLAGVVAGGVLAFAGSDNQPPNTSSAASPNPASITAKSTEAAWMTDFAAAQAKAKAEGKPMLLDFTGSDWCGWCMKLDQEIFSTAEFRDYAQKHFVLVKVDFPMRKPQPAAEKAQNEQLAARFQIEGYPTLVLLAPDGKTLGNLGYISGGPKPFIEKLAGMTSS